MRTPALLALLALALPLSAAAPKKGGPAGPLLKIRVQQLHVDNNEG